jgi:hypothetical protein
MVSQVSMAEVKFSPLYPLRAHNDCKEGDAKLKDRNTASASHCCQRMDDTDRTVNGSILRRQQFPSSRFLLTSFSSLYIIIQDQSIFAADAASLNNQRIYNFILTSYSTVRIYTYKSTKEIKSRDGKTMLKLAMHKYNVRMRARFICLTVGTGDGLLSALQRTFLLHKRL